MIYYDDSMENKSGFIKKLDRIFPLISQEDLAKYSRLFFRDLIAVLHNQKSSLPAILNPVHRMTPTPGFGVAVSIGGTNGYVSAFRISKSGVVSFLNRRLFSLPENTTKNDLFHLITQNILAVSNGRKKPFAIGMGFAYPLKPVFDNQFVDGILTEMTKGRTIEGLVGKKVGWEYHRFLIENYGMDTTVSVANDAICLLLGGDGTDIAGVVGTGLNFAYWEKRSSLAPLKLQELVSFVKGDIAINIESANFDKTPKSRLLDIVDKESDNIGIALAEKEASGAYLYRIFNAGKVMLLGKNFPNLSSSDQLNEIITGAYFYPKAVTLKTQKKAQIFADRIFHKSAQIVAIELCGIMQKIGKTQGIVPLVMEGGIFWKAQNYPSLVNLYVNMILPEVIPSFARLFGSSRRGIAILATGR
jgi:hexokinase